MSGIVGIFELDGVPVKRPLLQALTDYLTFRGPDAQSIRHMGSVGLGHTLFSTTFEAKNEQQPCSLDGEIWITADARIDGRSELRQKLTSNGHFPTPNTTDPELILHAYHVWGTACVKHLIGDFSFAIWDGRRNHLFCARDQLGVKPFYYAQIDNSFIFSNTLNCLRQHPAVSNTLNDNFITDYLIHGFNQKVSRSAFKDIQRLPAAHTLIRTKNELRIERYWQLPVEEPLQYKKANDYIEHFLELFDKAVNDRLRSDRISILMSGGLDSTSIAATARNLLGQTNKTFEMCAYSFIFEYLIPENELKWSQLAADHIGIPIKYKAIDEYYQFGWQSPSPNSYPEPADSQILTMRNDLFQTISKNSRVVLYGFGGDPLLYPSRSYNLQLLKQLRFGRLIKGISQFFRFNHRLPPLYIRTNLRRLRTPKQVNTRELPPWLSKTLLAQQEDAPNILVQTQSGVAHPTRPESYQKLGSPFWSILFENFDLSGAQFSLEARHPFFDLRLIRFGLRLPPVPWCEQKYLLRIAMRNTLPEELLFRPKAVLEENPFDTVLQRDSKEWAENLRDVNAVSRYVDVEKAIQIVKQYGTNSSLQYTTPELYIRPFALANWMESINNRNH